MYSYVPLKRWSGSNCQLWLCDETQWYFLNVCAAQHGVIPNIVTCVQRHPSVVFAIILKVARVPGLCSSPHNPLLLLPLLRLELKISFLDDKATWKEGRIAQIYFIWVAFAVVLQGGDGGWQDEPADWWTQGYAAGWGARRRDVLGVCSSEITIGVNMRGEMVICQEVMLYNRREETTGRKERER